MQNGGHFDIFVCPRTSEDISFFMKNLEEVWWPYLTMLLVCDLGKSE